MSFIVRQSKKRRGQDLGELSSIQNLESLRIERGDFKNTIQAIEITVYFQVVLKKMTHEELDKKLEKLVRYVFGDILVNLRSTEDLWRKSNSNTEKVHKYFFSFGESNLGTIELICVGIETFGRIFCGKKDEYYKNVSKDSFVSFIEKFFPHNYSSYGAEIYYRYRCALLHSHILGFRQSFYPTRNGRNESHRHLSFGNAENNNFVASPDMAHPRMVLNIDLLYDDFKKAVEKFLELALENKQNLENIERSLEDIPTD